MLRRKLAGALASAVAVLGLLPAVANAQPERVVAPEESDDYVTEFYVDPANPPVIDGVPTLTEDEIDEYRDKILQAEASGPPQDEIVPGQMWSDKVGLPEGVDKAEADQSEVTIARDQSQPQTMSLQATSTRCQTYWLAPQVCGAILDRYEQLGGLTSWLAFPLEPMTPNPDGQGQRQRFAGGFIYWHPETGAHAVSNMTASVWERNGWEAGWLGYPLGGEVPVQGSNLIDGELNGWVQEFQGGRIYRTPMLEGFQVASINGLILDRWLELGGPNSELGFPLADEAKAPDGEGRFSIFQHGAIYWHPQYGAWETTGAVGEIWGMYGGVESEWGYPVSAPVLDADAPVAISQEFSGGHLDVRAVASNAGTTRVAGKEINNTLIEYLEYKGLQLIGPGSSTATAGDWQQGPGIRVLSASLCTKVDSSTENFGGVSIPTNYDYWGCIDPENSPDPSSFARHDYCTWSPDQFPSPGKNAEFSGACSRHDICYDNVEAQGSGYGPCNSRLFDNMVTICAANYGVWDPRHATCVNTAGVYWSFVTGRHIGEN